MLNSTGLAFRAGFQARLGMFEEAHFTLMEFKAARIRDQRLSWMKADSESIDSAQGGFRALRRRQEDWEHISQELRLAGTPD